MLALGLSTQTLLAEADDLSLVVYVVLLNGVFAAVGDSCAPEVMLTVLGKEVLSSDLLDSRIKVGSMVQFFNALLVLTCSTRCRW